MNNFSIELAQQLVESTEEFPVEFDHAWIWLEYSRKDNAKRFLIENFQEEEDFLIIQELGSLASPRPKEKLLLTIDCLKLWGMMCGSARGKEVRNYFLECEKIAKQAVQNKLPQNYLEALKALVASEEEKQLLQQQKEQLQLQASEDKPYTILGKVSTQDEGELDLGEFAKLISPDFGRNKLIKVLKDMGYLLKQKGSEPYQKYVDRGWFTLRRDDRGYTYTVITNKGQVALIEKIKQRIGIQRTAVKMITQSVQVSLGIDY